MGLRRREFVAAAALALAGAATPGLARARQQSLGRDRLVLLGTQGGPFVRSYDPSRPASVVVYRGIPYVVDAGYGVTLKLLEAAIPLPALRRVFITHHHSDHNLELGPLLYNAWLAGLQTSVDVYAPVGLHALIKSYWESNRYDLETRIQDEGRPDLRTLVTTHEYSEGQVLLAEDVRVSALRNVHPPVTESFALKFELGEKRVVFSGDTTYLPALADFSRGADYLVHEVMYGPGVDALARRRPNAPRLRESILSHHTLAEDVGRIASMAQVKTVVLNHFVPPDDSSITPEVWFGAVRSTFAGEIVVGRDLLELPL